MVDRMAVGNSEAIIVLTNLPDRISATRLANLLVERRHAACVNILTECTSVYRWAGKVETAAEVLLMIKTSASAYPRLETEILAHHPYELPEIVSVPVATGLAAYLTWIATESVAE
jgi:periplasmic divalent cation tolerance protein